MKTSKPIKQTNCTCELVTTIELVHPKPGIELKEQQSSLSFPNVGPDLQCWECVHASAFDLPWEKSMFSHTNPQKSWNPSGWPARHEVLNGLVHEAWRLDAALDTILGLDIEIVLDTILDTILDSPFVNQFIVTGSFAAIHIIPEGKWPLQPCKIFPSCSGGWLSGKPASIKAGKSPNSMIWYDDVVAVGLGQSP